MDFLKEGLALELLARHFEGLGSALACMLPMVLLSAMVYPLHRRLIPPPASASPATTPAAPTPSPEQRPGRPLRSSRRASWALFPSAAIVTTTAVVPVWALAVWGSARFDWGLACGMGIGLLSACLSLKCTSFARLWCLACSHRGLEFPSSRTEKGAEKAAEKAAAGSSPAGENQDPGSDVLTAGEFLFFLLVAPTLVCEPELLKASARRPRRVGRAITEFSHALLTFVALHAACSAFVAPLMRVVASFLFSSNSCPGHSGSGGLFSPVNSSGCTSSWVDCAGWAGAAGLDGAGGGSGGWFFSLFSGGRESRHGGAFFESLSCCGAGYGATSSSAAEGPAAAGTGWPEFLAALAMGMLFSTPLVHSLTFYGFWHCVCLGYAELWGYPDRHFYGPWWLLLDEPDTMFRLWSSPVHRWLSSCIYRPITTYRGPTMSATPPTPLGRVDRGHRYGGVVAGNAGECVKDRQQPEREQREQQRPHPPGNPRGWPWRRLLGLLATFVFSSVVHEAVTYVAMRRTCWPFNTFTLVLATVIISGWDSMYPVRSLISDDEEGLKSDRNEESCDPPMTSGGGAAPPSSHSSERRATTVTPRPAPAHDTVASVAAGGQENACGSNNGGGTADCSSDAGGTGGGCRVSGSPKAGRKWRGWGAVAFFQVASIVMAYIVNFLAWQWWRHTLLANEVDSGRDCTSA
ncbi:unnamed protein product [Scytosiphon promiscuus]